MTGRSWDGGLALVLSMPEEELASVTLSSRAFLYRWITGPVVLTGLGKEIHMHHFMRLRQAITCLLPAVVAAISHANNMRADITVDNTYALYRGSSSNITSFIGSDANWVNAESWFFPYFQDEYLYVACWTDQSGLQGFLGTFTNLKTGWTFDTQDPNWQVTAAGITRAWNAPNPTSAEMNSYLAAANIGANASGGWVAPTAGPANPGLWLGGSYWPTIPGIPSGTRWIWYDSRRDLRVPVGPSFRRAPFLGFNHDELLIFRIPVDSVPDCLRFDRERVLCVPDVQGGYTYTFTVTNNSSGPIGHIYLAEITPGVTVSQDYFQFSPPLPPGASRVITLQLSGAMENSDFCFTALVFSPDWMDCCIQRHCIWLPPCDCFQILDERIAGIGLGRYMYSGLLQNLEPVAAKYVVFQVLNPAGLPISPNTQVLNPPTGIGMGQVAPISFTLGPNLSPGQTVLVRIIVLDFWGQFCCERSIPVRIPTGIQRK